MEEPRGPHILERGERFLLCWKEPGPEGVRCAGIDHQGLENEVKAAKDARERVREVEIWLRGLRHERDRADRKLAKKLKQVAAAVRRAPGYGEDCAFYGALGFVPLSGNRSGRPRKAKPNKTRRKKLD